MSDLDRERKLLRGSLGRTPECPDIEALAAARGRPDMERHVAACERCRAELALLHQFESAEPSPEEMEDVQWVEAELSRRRSAEAATLAPPVAIPQEPVRFPWRRVIPVFAACAALIIVVSVYQRPGDSGATSTVGSQPVWRSGRVIAVAPLGDLNSPPADFRWEAVSGAAGYRVRLLEVDGTAIWQGQTTVDHVKIPREVTANLTPGRAFQWDVDALDASGARIGSSALQSFHILVTHR